MTVAVNTIAQLQLELASANEQIVHLSGERDAAHNQIMQSRGDIAILEINLHAAVLERDAQAAEAAALREALSSLTVSTSGSEGMVWVEGCLPGSDQKIAALAVTTAGAERERIAELERALRPFANYERVLALLAAEDKKLSPTNEWRAVDPILGAKGQILTRGHFMKAKAALAAPAAQTDPTPPQTTTCGQCWTDCVRWNPQTRAWACECGAARVFGEPSSQGVSDINPHWSGRADDSIRRETDTPVKKSEEKP